MQIYSFVQWHKKRQFVKPYFTNCLLQIPEKLYSVFSNFLFILMIPVASDSILYQYFSFSNTILYVRFSLLETSVMPNIFFPGYFSFTFALIPGERFCSV